MNLTRIFQQGKRVMCGGLCRTSPLVVLPTLVVLWTLVALAAPACRRPPESEPDRHRPAPAGRQGAAGSLPSPGVRDVAERGPFKLTVEVAPASAWVGDPLEVRVTLRTPDDHVARLPEAADLGDWNVRAVRDAGGRPAPEGGLEWRRTFVVDGFSSGPREIPPLTVGYGSRPPAPDAPPTFDHELVSGTLKVELRSALTAQDSVTRPRDISAPLELPRTPWERWRVVLLSAATALAAAAALFVPWLLWRRRRASLPPVPPEVWALRLLGRLRPEEVEAGRAREFYYQLSEIVRAYIERKFALAAPEMTTEEFLTHLARNRAALPYDADRLRVFLEACDLVKYAAYRPRREDAEQALATARAFVNQTAAAGGPANTAGAHPQPEAAIGHRLDAGATKDHRLETGATQQEEGQAG